MPIVFVPGPAGSRQAPEGDDGVWLELSFGSGRVWFPRPPWEFIPKRAGVRDAERHCLHSHAERGNAVEDGWLLLGHLWVVCSGRRREYIPAGLTLVSLPKTLPPQTTHRGLYYYGLSLIHI